MAEPERCNWPEASGPCPGTCEPPATLCERHLRVTASWQFRIESALDSEPGNRNDGKWQKKVPTARKRSSKTIKPW